MINRRMRWECADKGCYRELCCPNLSLFDGCFPGKMSLGDVDGIIEIGGRFLMLEWKGPNGQLTTGQKIMYNRLTATCPFVVYVVDGNSETMEVFGYRRFWLGQTSIWKKANQSDLMCEIHNWVQYTGRGK